MYTDLSYIYSIGKESPHGGRGWFTSINNKEINNK
jgi:hypothetical protein